MIQLYPKGQTDFSLSGIELHPSEGSVNWKQNGQYDLELLMEREKLENIQLDYGMIIRCSVPETEIGDISLGMVSYWEIKAGQANVPLYSEIPHWVSNHYSEWNALRSMVIYSVGARVSYLGKNYQMIAEDPGSEMNYNHPPDNYPEYWKEISAGYQDGGKTIAQLSAGDMVVKTGDFNQQYMKASDGHGHEGFIEINKCQDKSETEERILPGFTIREQNFVITGIQKTESGHAVRIDAEHVSYATGRTMLGECTVVGVNAATAMMFIAGAMKEAYGVHLYCGLDFDSVDGEWSWKNAQAALLDPKTGLAAITGGRIIRDNLDIYLISNAEEDPEYEVAYGGNMREIKWSGNINSLVTRIYPLAKKEDGTTLTLPEEYVDSVLTVPYIKPATLNTGLKVGQEITNSDGTKIKLTEEDVYDRMRQQAQDMFTIDECDKATVSLDLDWVHLPKTEEFKGYLNLRNCAPGAWIRVINGPMGLTMNIQMTGYTFDPIRMEYKKGTFGAQKTQPSIPGYQLQSGAVSGRVLGQNAISGANIQAGAITAREIAANSITAENIASKVITTELLAAGAVTADEIAAGSITAEKIAALAITAAKIAADAITAEKIAAGAVSTDKLDAGAVTAGKIAAGAITAEKISASDLQAIQAKLEIADIASAKIGSADIGWAQIKELNAQSAFFGQTIFQEAVGGKLYVPRLAVGYAQMLSATIGDLVIQASNGLYYKLDVNAQGQVAATHMTPTAEEIENGYTRDGRTIYMGTDILATDLNTQNVYASHALMDEITANIINVDKLLAREAVIAWLNVQDISSNTYIQSTIGNWVSGSTITQTINGLSSRISSLGYGTTYMQPDEPDHDHLSAGDIWIQTIQDSTWRDIYENYSSWREIFENVASWQTLGAYPVMFVWDGIKWQEMYDSYLPTELATEIEQLNYQITLLATKTEVDELSGEITEYAAQIRIMADQIEQAVSTVNAKATSFYTMYDPRLTYDVTIGDIWYKGSPDTKSWHNVFDNFDTWRQVYETFDAWQDLLGSTTYVWNGFEWEETASRAEEITLQTRIRETDRSVEILASAQATIEGELYSAKASITVLTDQIRQEVQRATTAEGGKLEKTAQYQTADEIVSEAVRQAGTTAEGAYIKRTNTLQTAEQIVSAAESYTNGLLESYSTREQTSEAIRDYVSNNAYKIQSGIEILATGVRISGSAYVKIESGSQFKVTADGFGVDSTNGQYVMWAGAATASNSKFRITPGGRVTLTELAVLNADGTAETTINLRSIGVWWGSTIRSYVTSGGYVSSMKLSNGQTINFSRAAAGWAEAAAVVGEFDLDEEGAWISIAVPSASYKQPTSKGYDLEAAFRRQYNAGEPKGVTIGDRVGTTKTYAAKVIRKDDTEISLSAINCAAPYNDGETAGKRTGWSEAVAKVGTMSEEDDLVSITVPAVNYGQGRTASMDVGYIRTAGYNSGSPKGVTIGARVGTTKTYAAKVTRNDNTEVSLSAINCAVPYDDGYSAGEAAGKRTGWSEAVAKVGTMSVEDDLVSITVPAVNYGQGRTASMDVGYIRTAGYNSGHTAGYRAASPKGVTLGNGSGGSYWPCTVTRTDDTTVSLSVNCSGPYSAGVAAGEAKFAVHSGSLYTVDSHGVPTRYTGTLYDKIQN